MAFKRKRLSVVVLFCTRAFISSVVNYADGFSPVRTSFTGPSSLSAKARAGGKKRQRDGAAAKGKGFGAPPPTLDDVLATFRRRVPDDADHTPCPCGAGATYGDCCRPLHRGARPCRTMTDVLRSRYVAFAWRLVAPVMDTTHPSCRDYRDDRIAWARDLNRGGMFDSFEFVKLEAGEEEMSPDNEHEGYTNFKVTLRGKDDRHGAVAGQETVISERSVFLRDPNDGTWRYARGDVRSDVVGLEDTTLNV